MKASELIKYLQDQVKKNGDMEVFSYGCGTNHPLRAEGIVVGQHDVCSEDCCDLENRITKVAKVIEDYYFSEAKGIFL